MSATDLSSCAAADNARFMQSETAEGLSPAPNTPITLPVITPEFKVAARLISNNAARRYRNSRVSLLHKDKLFSCRCLVRKQADKVGYEL